MSDLQLPHHYASEVALIGSMILGSDYMAEALAIVPRAEDFHDQTHATIYSAILHVVDRLNPTMLDLTMIQRRLIDLGVYDKIGGDAKLLEITESVPSASNAPYYAKIVAEKAKLRRLIAACEKSIHAAYHVGGIGHDSAQEVIDEHESAVFELGQGAKASGAKPVGRLIAVELERIEKADTTTFTGTPTGFGGLDAKIQGLQNGEVVIIAARPSMGKTALGLNLVENIATRGIPIGLYSLEMSEQAVTQRLLSSRAKIESTLMRSGVIGGLKLTGLLHAAGELSESPIFIDDATSLTVMDLRARARRMVKQYGVKVIVVDYLQLLTDPTSKRDGRFVEVSAISRGVKALARELNIPIVMLAQLNRNAEAREGNRPRMADLALSGSIEQDADVVILIHREAYYHIQDTQWCNQNPEKMDLAELIVAKNRNGPTGVVALTWDAETTRFSNRSAQ